MNETKFFTLEQARRHAEKTHLRCLKTAKRTRRTLIFSHTTLLSLRGMNVELDTSLSDHCLHTTVDCLNNKSQLSGIEVHVWRNPMTQTMIDEHIAGVSPEQAICQIAQFTEPDSLVMAMDRLTCHNNELRQTTHEHLAEYINGLGRFTGSRRCRTALERSLPGTDSPQETLLRLRLTDAGATGATVNHIIPDYKEHTNHTVDIAYPGRQVAIEYDGEYHYTMRRWSHDLHKRNRLADLGWRVFVATKNDFGSRTALESFTGMILRALNSNSMAPAVYG